MEPQTQFSVTAAAQSFIQRVFLWMSGALGLSGLVAYTVYATPALSSLFIRSPWTILGLFIAQIVVVFALSSAIARLSYTTALSLFIGFSILNGLTLSSIFFVYTPASIVSVFFICAAMFLAMGLYGMTTSRDLTSWGTIGRMMLFGIIIAMVVNMFIRSAAIDYVVSIIGVGLFSALVAYDMQKLLQISAGLSFYQEGEYLEADRAGKTFALMGALTLYLDFVNLFLSLLRLLGNDRRK